MMKKIIVILFALFALISCQKEDANIAPLKADFTVDKTEIAAGDTVVFSDISQGMPSRLHWLFEGASVDTSILSSPQVIYELPGTYRVSLRISRAGQSDELLRENYITVGYGPLQADFSTVNTVVYINEEIPFSDLTKGVATGWSWRFKSETTEVESTDQNPNVTFHTAGVYTVSLTSSNPEYSSTSEKVNYFTVLDPLDLVADFAVQHATVPTGRSVQFTDASIGLAEAWQWEFEGASVATSDEKNPSVSYAQPGKYRVKLTVSNPFTSKVIEKETAITVLQAENLALLVPFDQGLADVSANNLPIDVQGSAPTFTSGNRFGVIGHTASFGGAGGLVIPDHAALNFGSGNFSVSLWVKTSSSNRMMLWQESGRNGAGDNQTWLRLGDNTSDRKIRFAAEDATGGFILNSERSVANGAWQHVVCVREGTRSLLYVNGVLAREGTTNSVKVVSNAGQFKIALQESATGFNNYFTGELDDLAVYRKALSAAEVRALFEL
ncbi:LamG-like jellyroll fold domain-containing protein [Sphingobacterium deserti]|uniref:PKD domain-containing protein n=1 Tax=Sphingobacterium deserti TaxID=1229276 RepID=A0A0B8T6U5_9SPHI|nr:PKD domain-containing protein [Sphingobacterium deserti]KGE13939.1 PKD domain-containing protein [Sphingobacterium deserti]